MRLFIFVSALACEQSPPPKPIEAPAKQNVTRPVQPVPPPAAIVQQPKTSTGAHDHGPPEFVTRGSGVFEDGGRRAFFGLGKTKGLENRKLAHVLADQAADAELARLLSEVNAKALPLSKKKDKAALDKLAAEWVEKSSIVDHWIDHDEEQWYSLKKIDVGPYVDAIATPLGLDDSAKATLRGP